ncbi:Various polyols ABC transporter, ATP-binding component [gamma proteobacterium IMCC1989]|nr:Various polyols ABC transporter, ATP-binding component [gamma proteobacterium IMCC1989]
MSSLEIKKLHKNFSNYHAIRGVDLQIEKGEFTVFVGPSGCGKSTLLRLIAGLEVVTSGSILLNDQDITDTSAAERDLAMVFQSYALYPHMSVAENMSFALKIAKVDPKIIAEKVADAAEILQLTSLLDRKPKALSGGQRQRVAIGRAIVRQPSVFLFDEPLSNLDASLRVQMRQELSGLHKRLKSTMIYVTHDQVEAMTLADKVVILNAGNVEQVGTPLNVYYNPASRFVAEFIGTPKMSFIPMSDDIKKLIANEYDGADPRKLTSSTWLGVRPESVTLSSQLLTKAGLTGKVSLVERLGAETLVYIDYLGEHKITARADSLASIEAGADIQFSIDFQNVHGFDDDGLRLSPDVTDNLIVGNV